jgi:hypothetical protein
MPVSPTIHKEPNLRPDSPSFPDGMTAEERGARNPFTPWRRAPHYHHEQEQSQEQGAPTP